MQIVHLHHLTVLLLIVVGCASPLDFGSDTESKALTYAEYVGDGGDAWFDPVGASDIYQRSFSTRDGYDVWWRFAIPSHEGDQLVAAVSRENKGPNEIEWNATTAYPITWKPDDSPPTWWSQFVADDVRSIHWCYNAGAAERHYGWHFLYTPESETMYVWHWNHQWSTAECTRPLPEKTPEQTREREPG